MYLATCIVVLNISLKTFNNAGIWYNITLTAWQQHDLVIPKLTGIFVIFNFLPNVYSLTSFKSLLADYNGCFGIMGSLHMSSTIMSVTLMMTIITPVMP